MNGKLHGRPNAGVDMTFSFGDLIAHAAKTRPLSRPARSSARAPSRTRIVNEGPGLPIAEGGHGYACIAEQRTVETIRHGAPRTPFMKFGDVIRIEMMDEKRHSIFGAIEQKVTRYGG